MFHTSILTENTVSVKSQGGFIEIIEYRPPQVTGIWLDGSEIPIKVPLPGLVLAYSETNGGYTQTRLAAVKERPTTPDCRVYEVPLPNVWMVGTMRNNNICWGTVKRRPRNGVSLAPIWEDLFSTPFGNHEVYDKVKSKKYTRDVRQLLIDLSDKKKTKFPVSILKDAGAFGAVFGILQKEPGVVRKYARV